MEKYTSAAKRSQPGQDTVMIIDDTPENLKVLETMLKQAGYTVRPAPNGSIALKSVQVVPPDLILLDILMPGMDGYEVCTHLKADERTRDIPVIFLSAIHEYTDKVKAFQVGGVDYITKPFQPEEVLARVKTHLALRRAHMQLEDRNTELLQTNTQLAHEIAERQRAEEALQRSHAELEHRVAQRTAELAESNRALRVSEQAAREFQDKLKALHEVSVALSEAVVVDEVCRRSIELGRKRLGFDRLGLFLLQDDHETVRGTFGTDERGRLRDERDLHWTLSHDTRLVEVLHANNRVAVWHDTPLRDHWQEVGRGWNAMAILRIGDHALGWLAADNLISQKPLASYELELLSLYGKTIGHFITQKRAEERLAQLKQAIEFMQLGLTITDLDGTIIYTNQAEAQMHGYRVEELLGQRSNLFAPAELRMPRALRTVERWDGLIRESLNVRKDGTTFPVRLMSEIVRGSDGSPCAIITSCEDITERKALEEERKHYRDHLEEQVKVRTAELIAANRAKSEFLANMSHELRTPLNAILGFSQILSHNLTFDDEYQEYLEAINRNGEHLLTLINQVLDLSKIEASRMVLNKGDFDLHLFLDELENIFRLRAETKHLHLEVERAPDIPQYVRTDEVKLRQVLINLLNNAIKFTQQGKISLKVSELDELHELTTPQLPNSSTPQLNNSPTQQLFFQVSDTGPGIAPAELDNVFEAFVQAETGRRSGQGTGLGLTISQKFVHLLGGTIQVDSEPGTGTTFTFTIPIDLPGPAMVTAQPARKAQRVIGLAEDQPASRILIVDDTPDSRRVLVKFLSLPGFEVREAEDGQAGVDMWQTWNPDLIFM
ncbi:response regulator, partial [candidate division KSB3 bacterium]|nr:response regulator [candidate division KSB3 bacterium]